MKPFFLIALSWLALSVPAPASADDDSRLMEQSLQAADRADLPSAGAPDAGVSADSSSASIRVALIGDSTCATWGPSSPGYRGWGEYMGWRFKSAVEVRNFAVGGIASSTFIQNELGKVLKYHPHFVMIDLGINDSAKSNPGYASPAQYEVNLAYLANQLRAKGAQVLFVPPHALNMPVNGKYGDGALKPYRDAMISLARQQHSPLLNLFARTRDYYNQIGVAKARKQFYDGVHFNQAGANQAAAFVVDELKRSGSGLKAYTSY